MRGIARSDLVALLATCLPLAACDGGGGPAPPVGELSAAAPEPERTEGSTGTAAEAPKAPVERWIERSADGVATAIPDCYASQPAPGSALLLEQGPPWKLVAEGSGIPASVTWFVGDAVVGPLDYPLTGATFDWRSILPAGTQGPVEVPIAIEARDSLGFGASCAYSVLLESLEVCRVALDVNFRSVEALEGGRAFVWDVDGGALRSPLCGLKASWKVEGGEVVSAWWDRTCDRPIFAVVDLSNDASTFGQLAAGEVDGCSAWSKVVPWNPTAVSGATEDHVWWPLQTYHCLQPRRMSDGGETGPPFCPGEILQVVPSSAGTLAVRSEGGTVSALLGGEVLWTTTIQASTPDDGKVVTSPEGGWIGFVDPANGEETLHLLDSNGEPAGTFTGSGPWALGDDGTVVGTGSSDPGGPWTLVAWREGGVVWTVPSEFSQVAAKRVVVGNRLWLVSNQGTTKLSAHRLSDGEPIRSLQVDVASWTSDFAFRDGFVWLAGNREIVKLGTEPVMQGGVGP